jgi:hypothetical protein
MNFSSSPKIEQDFAGGGNYLGGYERRPSEGRMAASRTDVSQGPRNTGAAPAAAQPQTSAETAFDRLDKQLESLASQLGELRKSMHDLHQTMRSETGKPAGEKKK